MTVKNVWLGTDGGYAILYDDGRRRWHNVPKGLETMLSLSHLEPAHVAFSRDDYQIIFTNNASQFKVTDPTLERILREEKTKLGPDRPRSQIIFGENPSSYFVRLSDGNGTPGDTWGMSLWNDMAAPLRKILTQRNRLRLPWIRDLVLGPRDSFFVRFKDGTFAHRGFDDLVESMEEIYFKNGNVTAIRAAPDNSHFFWLQDDRREQTFEGTNLFTLHLKDAAMVPISCLRYTQDSISAYFTDGRAIELLVAQLRLGGISVEDVEPIAAYLGRNGIWHSTCNRRLWAFKQAGVRLVPVVQVSPQRRMKVLNRGRTIKIRGLGAKPAAAAPQKWFSGTEEDSDGSF